MARYMGGDPPSVAVASKTTTVGDSSATALPATVLANRVTITITNVGSETVYVGASNVSTANGLPITAGSTRAFDLGAQVTLYAISASGNQDVRTLEQS